jgi:uncharacterized protein YndB with AHSA1/START domain
MNESTRTVERCLPIAAPRSEVYKALLDPAALSRWMYATVQWKPLKGAAYRIDWKDSSLPAHAQGEFLEIQENRRVVLSWFMERDGVETVASFDLVDQGSDATVVRFRHTGFPGGPEWQTRFDMVALEWDKVLENLRFLVEEGHGGLPFYLREQVELPASRERVYAHWVAPAAIESWLAREAFVDPAPGGEVDLLLNEGGRAHGSYRILVPGKHLRLMIEEDGNRSLIGVSFWPSDTGAGSVLTVTQRSYALDESARVTVRQRWQEAFARLRTTLERRPGRWPRSGARVIEIERVVSAPRDRVWKAVADAVGQSSWFCDRAEFVPRTGAPYAFLWTGWGEVRGEVLAVEPNSRLTLSWDMNRLEATTVVEYRLTEEEGDPGRTRIRLSHSDWGEGPLWDGAYDATRSGWGSALALLEFYLRRGSLGPRRSFLLRRRIPVPAVDVWSRIETPERLVSWAGPDSMCEPREGGKVLLRSSEGTMLEGQVTMADPASGIAIAIESPEPSFVDLSWTQDRSGTRVLASGIAYGVPESWPQQQRVLWGERLERLGGPMKG